MSARPPGDDVPARAAAAAERVGQALRVLVQRAAQEHGLSPIGVQLLLRLADEPPGGRRPGALAGRFDVSAASISDSLAVLERRGLVERRREPDDRRAVAVALTPAGRDLAERLGRVASPVEDAIAALPRDDQEALLRALLGVVERLHRDGTISVARMCVTCRHFRRHRHAGDAPHHCALLDMPLGPVDLRVDCPEHERAA